MLRRHVVVAAGLEHDPFDALRRAAGRGHRHGLVEDRAGLVERGVAVEPEAEAGDEVGDRLAIEELLEIGHW